MTDVQIIAASWHPRKIWDKVGEVNVQSSNTKNDHTHTPHFAEMSLKLIKVNINNMSVHNYSILSSALSEVKHFFMYSI